jgi:tRNA(His) guanylyltransferase
VNDSLGDRMKMYERTTRTHLMPHSYAILRVDGRAFHSYLRHAQKPFDPDFMRDMQAVAAAMCQHIQGAVFAYGQSDEISFLLSDIAPESQPWFGGVVQKIASVAAAKATISLAHVRGTFDLPHFDARVFNMPSSVEVRNYFIWRERDAVRNSISMAAQAYFSHKELHGVNSGEMQEMLFQQHGINWNDYPTEFRRGWTVTREPEVLSTDFVRAAWDIKGAPHFTFDCEFFDRYITSEG